MKKRQRRKFLKKAAIAWGTFLGRTLKAAVKVPDIFGDVWKWHI